MKYGSRLKARRALSTVVTTVMLLAAVSVLGSGLVGWSNSNFAYQKSSIGNQTSTQINTINESFVIEDVWFYSNGSYQYANVTIRNTGSSAIMVTNIYVNSTQVWNARQSISAGALNAISGIPVNWGSGKPQTIWVKTARGNSVTQVWQP